jgi:hypothetical protein
MEIRGCLGTAAHEVNHELTKHNTVMIQHTHSSLVFKLYHRRRYYYGDSVIVPVTVFLRQKVALIKTLHVFKRSTAPVSKLHTLNVYSIVADKSPPCLDLDTCS